MKKILFYLVVAVFVWTHQSHAETISFGDSTIYWNTWPGTSSYGYNDNALDVIGNPNITGGSATISNTGYLQNIRINMTSGDTSWSLLAPGSLFIDLVDGQNDWDYVVNTMGVIVNGRYSNVLGAGDYSLYSVSLSRNYFSGHPYILSGRDVTGVWSGYVIRDNHPIGVNFGAYNGEASAGSVYFSGWSPSGSSSYSVVYDFTRGGAVNGLYIGSNDLTIGWAVTCANDVLLENINNPVPEPGTIVLLGAGLAGFGIYARRRMKA